MDPHNRSSGTHEFREGPDTTAPNARVRLKKSGVIILLDFCLSRSVVLVSGKKHLGVHLGLCRCVRDKCQAYWWTGISVRCSLPSCTTRIEGFAAEYQKKLWTFLSLEPGFHVFCLNEAVIPPPPQKKLVFIHMARFMRTTICYCLANAHLGKVSPYCVENFERLPSKRFLNSCCRLRMKGNSLGTPCVVVRSWGRKFPKHLRKRNKTFFLFPSYVILISAK